VTGAGAFELDPEAQARAWCDRVWDDRQGWAVFAFGVGGHFTGTGSYEFGRFEERPVRWPADRERVLREAFARAGDDDVFVSPYLRSSNQRRKATALPSRVLYAEVDDIDRVRGFESKFVGPGGLVVSSGHGLHVYLSLPDELDPADLEHWNRRPALRLEADAGWDASKLLRLPGTLNLKDRALCGNPLPVRLVEFTPLSRDLTLDELDALLPLAEPAHRTTVAVEPEPLPEPLPLPIATRIRETPNDDRSKQSFAFVGACRDAGLSDGQTLAAALKHEPTVAKYGARVTEEVARSLSKLASANGARSTVQAPAEHGAGVALADVLSAVRKYLDVTPDESAYIIVSLAVAVAKELDDEEPLWVILAGASGSGKTEAIRLPALVADARVDELTRAGLLSYAPGRKARRTGLLARIPSVAFATISDFSTVVTMGDREARARMFGMLRVVYDGRVYRSIGGAPASQGDALEWEGHLTLLAGATNAIDTHLSFEAALGERLLLFRVDESDADRARRRTVFSTDRERVPELRKHAQELAATLVLHAREQIPKRLSDETRDAIVDAAVFCAHARTGVQFEGTGKYRVPVGYPAPEEPMRLAGQLYRLARCLVALGLTESQAAALAIRAACDSVPLARFKALREVADSELATVSSVWRAIGRGNRWGAKWELMALEAIGMVEVDGNPDDPAATCAYTLADQYRGVYESVGSPYASPLSSALSVPLNAESQRESPTLSYTCVTGDTSGAEEGEPRPSPSPATRTRQTEPSA
jgi:hypothetical protein